jgi:hypothetical protein
MSSDVYGGNKVRTLEFQLACAAAAHRSRVKDPSVKARVYSLGGPGSNQWCVPLPALRCLPPTRSDSLLCRGTPPRS